MGEGGGVDRLEKVRTPPPPPQGKKQQKNT